MIIHAIVTILVEATNQRIAARSDRTRWIALFVVCLGQLMIVLDTTIVNVALPSIQRDLHFSQSSLTWVIDGYLITFGSLLLLAGRLGDLFGRKRIFLIGLASFVVASMICGLAQSEAMLIGARFAQGAAAALTSAVVVAIISVELPEAGDRAKAMSAYTFVVAGGASLGLLPMPRDCRCCSSALPTRTWNGRRRWWRGTERFLRRLWRVVGEAADESVGGEPGDGALARKTHHTIARVTDDLGRRHRFDTPISAVMELVNELGKAQNDPAARFAAETAVSLIHPYAPHIAEELWERLGHERLWEQAWPVADPALLEEDTFELVVQVNGKVRDRLKVPSRPARGGARRTCEGIAEGAGALERRADPADDRRAAQARESRRRLARAFRHTIVTFA